MKKLTLIIVFAFLVVSLAGCGYIRIRSNGKDIGNSGIFSSDSSVEVSDTKVDKSTINVENGAKAIKYSLEFGVGQLNVKGGSSAASDATFTYNVVKWKPEVKSSLNGITQEVSINQPNSKESIHTAKNTKYIWDVALNKDMPVDFNLYMGVGKGNISLKDMDIQNVNIKAGVGDITLDMSGNYKNDVNVDISGGVGNIKLYIPSNIGVCITAEKGIGNVKCSGLDKNGSKYTNEKYGKTSTSINIQLKTGVGSVDIEEK